MKVANVRELRNNSHRILARLPREDVVITRRGKPVAAVIYLDENLLDSYVIAHHPRLLAGIERDLGRWKAGKLRTYTLNEVARQLRRLHSSGTRSRLPERRHRRQLKA